MTSIALRRSSKLSAKYFDPFQVLQWIGPVAYKLDLPSTSRVHQIFNVSFLKKKTGHNVEVQGQLPAVGPKVQFQIEPLAILDLCITKKNHRPITQVLVQWSYSIPEDSTWQNFYDLQGKYPHFQP